MSWVLRVSKPGYNVLTETDKRNLIFDTANNVFKVKYEGTITVSVNPPGVGFSNYFEHNLGYVPIFFVLNTDDGLPLPYGSDEVAYYCYATSTRLYVLVDDISGASPHTATFKYQIMADKII